MTKSPKRPRPPQLDPDLVTKRDALHALGETCYWLLFTREELTDLLSTVIRPEVREMIQKALKQEIDEGGSI